MHEMPLPNPADWEHVLVEEEGDMGRIQRLTSAALDLPTLPTDTGFRRAPLVYGETKALLCGLAEEDAEARKLRPDHARGGVLQ